MPYKQENSEQTVPLLGSEKKKEDEAPSSEARGTPGSEQAPSSDETPAPVQAPASERVPSSKETPTPVQPTSTNGTPRAERAPFSAVQPQFIPDLPFGIQIPGPVPMTREDAPLNPPNIISLDNHLVNLSDLVSAVAYYTALAAMHIGMHQTIWAAHYSSPNPVMPQLGNILCFLLIFLGGAVVNPMGNVPGLSRATMHYNVYPAIQIIWLVILVLMVFATAQFEF